jgi:hypothetical protein
MRKRNKNDARKVVTHRRFVERVPHCLRGYAIAKGHHDVQSPNPNLPSVTVAQRRRASDWLMCRELVNNKL